MSCRKINTDCKNSSVVKAVKKIINQLESDNITDLIPITKKEIRQIKRALDLYKKECRICARETGNYYKCLEAAAQNRSDDRLRLSKAEGELRGRLAQAGQEGAGDKLAAVGAEITRWQERISAFEEERDALILLVDELSRARASRRTKFFAPVRQAVDPLLSMVLGNASLAYDDRLGPDELERNGMREKLTRLSGGTREQIAVLTRLGFAQVMASKGRHVPIVIDDALVYSDDDRIQRLFDAINVVAADVQIIAFSCRQKTFESLGGKNIYPSRFETS